MKNKIEDLRNHLFATLEALQDNQNPMDLARAKTISDVAQTLINSAKVEVDHLKVTGALHDTSELPDNTQRECVIELEDAGEHFVAKYIAETNCWMLCCEYPQEDLPHEQVKRWAYLDEVFGV